MITVVLPQHDLFPRAERVARESVVNHFHEEPIHEKITNTVCGVHFMHR
jgi:hypothetical protein